MELKDAIDLINDDSLQSQSGAIWVDLGCGSGLFSYALANILLPGSIIYAIDKTSTALIKRSNPNNNVIKQQRLDFSKEELNLSRLDGILMANSLHFVKDKLPLIQKLGNSLREDSGFIIIEYDTDVANQWVPYPINYISLQKLFETAGYSRVRKYNERPSAFRTSSIYSAFISR